MSNPTTRTPRTLIAAGVLLIIGSVLCLIAALYSINMAAILASGAAANRGRGTEATGIWILFGFVALFFGLPFGLTSAIQSLRRKQFDLCITGAILLLFCAAPSFVVPLWLVETGNWVSGDPLFYALFPAGTLTIPFASLTLLGIGFLLICRREFR